MYHLYYNFDRKRSVLPEIFVGEINFYFTHTVQHTHIWNGLTEKPSKKPIPWLDKKTQNTYCIGPEYLKIRSINFFKALFNAILVLAYKFNFFFYLLLQNTPSSVMDWKICQNTVTLVFRQKKSAICKNGNVCNILSYTYRVFN